MKMSKASCQRKRLRRSFIRISLNLRSPTGRARSSYSTPQGRYPGQRPWLSAAGVNIASIFNNFINHVKKADKFFKSEAPCLSRFGGTGRVPVKNPQSEFIETFFRRYFRSSQFFLKINLYFTKTRLWDNHKRNRRRMIWI
jgi:hypothetical protein